MNRKSIIENNLFVLITFLLCHFILVTFLCCLLPKSVVYDLKNIIKYSRSCKLNMTIHRISVAFYLTVLSFIYLVNFSTSILLNDTEEEKFARKKWSRMYFFTYMTQLLLNRWDKYPLKKNIFSHN